MKVQFNKRLSLLFKKARYKVIYGGRGSGKSHGVAEALILIARSETKRILCTREFQASISDSVKKLLVDKIDKFGFANEFTVTETSIKHNTTKSEFIFKGLAKHINSIKSMEGIDICWIEEGQTISENSLDILIPTIRKEGSEIWITFNPEYFDDPVYQRFVHEPPNDGETIVEFINWNHNPWFPEVLDFERKKMQSTDLDRYNWIWEGELRKNSDAQILRGKVVVRECKPNDDDFLYQGLDYGFSNDPAGFIRCWIRGNTLYIDHAFYGKGIENDELIDWMAACPSYGDYEIYADNARPETTSYLAKRRTPSGRYYVEISSADKWPNSIEDGIAFLRSFDEIVVHPRCGDFITESRRYSYKVDPKTGEVSRKIVDKDNHLIDALRYALYKLIQASREQATIYDSGFL